MFTGLISDVGEVVARNGGVFEIACSYPAASIALGASICCDGVCLTAKDVSEHGAGARFIVDASNETLSKTTLDSWQAGRKVNLERSLRAGDELGGHIVSGHVDGTAKIVSVTQDGESRRFVLEAPEHLARYIAPKGSIAMDGTSLTVKRGFWRPLRRQPHSAHLDGDDVGREKAGRSRQHRGRRFRALRGAPSGVPAVNEGLPTKTSGAQSVLSPIEDILEDMQNGRMVVLVDAEDRENEGDLVIPAQMATPDAINFMAKHGRGLICLTLTQGRAAELRLQSQARSGTGGRSTAFTQSIEAKEGITTGISAFDRARTIATAIDPTKGAADIVSPGHVFPLIAREGGVLVRAGHTEASVDLARLAGLVPAAVICEIMNDDGTMARMGDLVPFAKQHGLKIGAIEDLIAYRLKNDRIIRHVAKTRIETRIGGDFDLHVYETTVEPAEHLAIVKGKISSREPVLVRVQALNVFNDVLGVGGENETIISQSLRAIEAEGRGVLVLIRDLRPKALSEWVARKQEGHEGKESIKDRRQVEIGIGSQILVDLGVKDMELLTTSPAHVYVGLEAFGLRVSGTRKI